MKNNRKTKKQILGLELKGRLSDIIRILKKYGVKKVGIFGSYATGENNNKSDIDILIEVKKGTSLIGFVGIKLDLEDHLNKKVDLLTYKSIHPYLKKKILREEVRII